MTGCPALARRYTGLIAVGMAVLVAVLWAAPAASASAGGGYVPVNGAGSTWSQNALDQWRRDVAGQGILINYAGTGSTEGRDEFIAGQADFAVSEIPFQAHPGGGAPPERPGRGYAYVPAVAGGTALMYHLTFRGRLITNLRLSGQAIAEIFTGVIRRWDDPQIEADNPGLSLPDELITPVVRADSAGTTAQFTGWLDDAQQTLWRSYCHRVGLAEPCGAVSTYPITAGMRAQSGSLGVADYVAQAYGQGSIGYVETSYARQAGYPVAAVLNTAGYYVTPTAQAVAVALLRARINTDRASPGYLTEQLDGVYADPDPRAYPISSYSYLIVPTTTADGFTDAKGATLAAFGAYALCQGQDDVAALGYSPLPVNLVSAGLAQLDRIPGARNAPVSLASCHNPTFSASGVNTLARTAPAPPSCARLGTLQCGAPGPARPAAGPTTGAFVPGQTGAPDAFEPAPVTVPAGDSWTGTQTTMAVLFAVLLTVLLGPLALTAAVRRRGRRPLARRLKPEARQRE